MTYDATSSPTNEQPSGVGDTLATNQRMLWMSQQQHPHLPLYEMCHAYDIRGPIDPIAFQAAFERWVATTPVMRTVSSDRQWSDVSINPQVEKPCEYLDLRSSVLVNDEVAQLVTRRMQRTFDPTRALYDSLLIQIADDQFQWIMRLHHLMTDGANSRVMLSQLAAWYLAIKEDGPSPQMPQFDDYLQHEKIHLLNIKKHASWWAERQQKRGSSQFYSATTFQDSAEHVRESLQLSDRENRLICELAQSSPFRQFTPTLSHFNIFATALSALLVRLQQQSRVRFGATVHGRTSSQFNDTVGLFMQLLPMEVEAQVNESLESLSKRVGEETKGFLQHAVPGVMSPESAGATDVALNLVDLSVSDFAGYPSSMQWLHNGFGDVGRQVAISVISYEAFTRWEMLFDFNRSAFTASQRERFVNHFRNMLGILTEHPTTMLGVADFMTLGERKRLLAPSVAGSESQDENLWSEFCRVCEIHGQSIAVESAEGSITYDQLRQEAEGLANLINDAACGPLVPITCRRSVNGLFGIMGVLASGRCFLPIDLEQPTPRIDSMLLASGVAQYVDASSFPELKRTPSTVTDSQCSLTSGACYVLFTSGSTGKPNGVVVGHSSVRNLLKDFDQLAPISHGRCSWWTSAGFDVSIYEVFSALLFGHTLCIPDDNTRSDPDRLFDWMLGQRITSAYLPPFFLSDFDQYLEHTKERSLKRLLVGVESIPQRRLSSIARKHSEGLAIINGYGPTEATVCATRKRIDPLNNEAGHASIGVPVNGNVVRIVDSDGELVPQGVPGELWIGGSGLAFGYLNNPELTEARFVRDPRDDRSHRWYCSGDRVRMLDDGSLQFIGRIDNQIKLHGHRIEPAEIESILLELDGVTACVVGPWKTQESQKLVAYYSAPKELSFDHIISQLRGRIPRHLIPHAFIHVDRMPIGINGKIARDRLPDPEPSVTTSSRQYVPPATTVEKAIADVWGSVLGIKRVSATDDFFALGGDSISAIQITSRLARQGLHIATADLFVSTSVRQLAQRAGINKKEQHSVLERVGSVPITPIQHWLLDQTDDERASFCQVMRLSLVERVDHSRLQRCLDQLIIDHESLRMQFSMAQGQWKAHIPERPDSSASWMLNHGEVYECSDVRDFQQVESSLYRAINIGTGQMLQAAFVRLADRQEQLWIAIHHLSVDAVSWSILLDDLETLYQAGGENDVSQTIGSTIDWDSTSFRQCAIELQSKAQDTEWTQRASGRWGSSSDHPHFQLPRDYPHQAENLQRDSDTLTFELSHAVSADLLAKDGSSGKSRIEQVLIASFASAVSKWSGQSLIAFDRESHGRDLLGTEADLSRTVGWFTTLHPIWIQLPKDPTLQGVLESVADQFCEQSQEPESFGLLKYLCHDPGSRERLRQLPDRAILMNYFGRPSPAESTLFTNHGELELYRSANSKRPYIWEINASFRNGLLVIDWTYSSKIHRQVTINDLGQRFLESIASLVSCMDHTDSSSGNLERAFPLAKLNAEKLEKVAAMLKRASGSKDKGMPS